VIVCPLCEHAQAAGAECEVCGKRLATGPAAIPWVPPVEGLEATRVDAVDAPEAPMPEMERTHHEAVDAAGEPVPGVEATHALPVDAPEETIPDLERTAAEGIPDDGPAALPESVVCRYCRTPAAPGERVCGRCGMRLPVYEPVLDILLGTGDEAPGPHPCPSCGIPATGVRCRSCGGRLVAPGPI
jgi:hypothetical protein